MNHILLLNRKNRKKKIIQLALNLMTFTLSIEIIE